MKCNKIFLSVFFVAILALCLCILPARAEAATTSDLTFKLNEDGKSYAVTGCNVSLGILDEIRLIKLINIVIVNYSTFLQFCGEKSKLSLVVFQRRHVGREIQ